MDKYANVPPYGYKGNQWLSYEDIRSVGYKARYARSELLVGVMMWSIDLDDFQGNCNSGLTFLPIFLLQVFDDKGQNEPPCRDSN